MKVFVGNPLYGNPGSSDVIKNWLRAVCGAEEEWGKEVKIMDSLFLQHPDGAQSSWFLGKSIETLVDADALILCPGWAHTPECRIMYAAATELDKPIYTVAEDGALHKEIIIKPCLNGVWGVGK